MPVDSRTDISRLDLFIDGARTGLLDLASGRRTGEDLLDDAAPEWREWLVGVRAHDVLVHEDGSASIVPRPEAAPGEE
jgi:hypothetical protein